MADKQPDTTLLLASLCDGIKRLEWAIAAAGEDRTYYLEEAKKRRQYVEKHILGDDTKGPIE